MMYACEVMANIIAKEKAEAEAKRKAEEARIAKAFAKFEKNIESIDAYVERALIANGGKVELLIDHGWLACDGFWYFAKKNYCYSSTKPYWSNKSETEEFHLETYIEYLRQHCFEVELVNRPFTAYSSTGKSSMEMTGKTLKISI